MEKKHRLKRRKDFNRVYNRGKSFSNRELVVYVYYNKETPELVMLLCEIEFADLLKR